jgi:hypothetical protein
MKDDARKPDRLDGLLSRGRLGGPGREHVLHRALAQARIVHPPWWRRRPTTTLGWGTPLAAAAALVALVVVTSGSRSAFRAKGSAKARPLLSLACGDGNDTRCAQGNKLLFRVAGAEQGGFLAAYAERASAGGERVWFFTAEPVAARPNTQVMPEAVQVGSSLRPGRYRVHLLLSATALDRQAVVAPAGPVLGRQILDLEVTP